MHFIGIKGVSMSFLAELMKREGVDVTGSDLITGGHTAHNVHGADEVIYSLAVSRDNPEFVEAQRLGIPLFSRSELLGRVAAGYKSVTAVSGTHGKTTTTAMLMYALGKGATVHFGGSVNGVSGQIGGNKDLFITEACEYKECFLSLRPDVSIVLNVELDHADFFKTYADFYEAFDKLMKKSRMAFVCGDNEAKSLHAPITYTFGLNRSNDYYAKIIGEKSGYYSFVACGPTGEIGAVSLSVRGEHNVCSAMAAIGYCAHFGYDYRGIERFKGVDRRFETLSKVGGVEYISDYAHHPHEIDCTLQAARKVFGRILVVFEPHTYTRTQAFESDFIRSLARFDGCIILPIYAAREQPIDGVSSFALAEKGGFLYAKDYENAGELIDGSKKSYDAVIFMGAGSIDGFAREYVFRLK